MPLTAPNYRLEAARVELERAIALLSDDTMRCVAAYLFLINHSSHQDAAAGAAAAEYIREWKRAHEQSEN